MKYIKTLLICLVIYSGGNLLCDFFHWDYYLTAFICGSLYFAIFDDVMHNQ